MNNTNKKANKENKLICPICGSVWDDNKLIATASSLSSWIKLGYEAKACPDCTAKGLTVGVSGILTPEGIREKA